MIYLALFSLGNESFNYVGQKLKVPEPLSCQCFVLLGVAYDVLEGCGQREFCGDDPDWRYNKIPPIYFSYKGHY